ncbi:MAG: c-type cytochrome biogenesis protein CcsB [Elusimicrobia bacterium]|nr:c-type cytochrome biogenesis protein CcsB [Elusimicrobiota bacterium]
MMQIALKLSFVFYGMAVGLTLVGFLLNKKWKFLYSGHSLLAGWAASTAYIISRWYLGGRAPMSNQYESMIFLIWAFVAAFLVFRKFSVRDMEWLSPWTGMVALLALGSASFLESDITPLVPALQSNWLLIHVSTVMTGYGALLLSFLGGAVLLFTDKGQTEKRQGLESITYRSCLVGFWLLSMGIITGAVWANSAWGSYWSWDPKETWSLITWLYYAVAIHLRRTRGWREDKFAHLMIWGFVLVMFTYFGVNYLMSGLHSYGRGR